ncbi:MAG: hypothetical protein H6811_01820 [Phycisphaeraceae bacterium]|nr:hypothetical protein [Phycisphaeraceae bacterium]
MSPSDAAILAALQDPALLPAALAGAGLSETALPAWFAQLHIQDNLTARKALDDYLHARYLDDARREAIDALRAVARETQDLVERRLAAAAILRALSAHARRPRAIAPQDSAPDPTQPPDSTRPRDAALARSSEPRTGRPAEPRASWPSDPTSSGLPAQPGRAVDAPIHSPFAALDLPGRADLARAGPIDRAPSTQGLRLRRAASLLERAGTTSSLHARPPPLSTP